MFTLRNTLANTNKLSSTTSTFLQQPVCAKSRPPHSSIRECQVPKVNRPRSSLSFAPIAYLCPSSVAAIRVQISRNDKSIVKCKDKHPCHSLCAVQKKLIKEFEVLISSGVAPLIAANPEVIIASGLEDDVQSARAHQL